MQNAIRTARTLLPSNGSITQSQIDDAVDIILNIPLYSHVDKNSLIKEIQSIYNVRVDEFRIIEGKDRRLPWINDRKSQIWQVGKPTFWGRYRDYLEVEKNFPPDVLNKLDRLTDRVLDGLFDPIKNVIIDKRGLVVGQVQSGKTSNYTGVICKAADAGFKFIIVLAGIHNNLRSQTQLRVDEGFLGFDTQHQRAFNQNNRWLGVGKIDQSIIAHSLTSSLDRGDFSSGAANGLGINFNTNEPIIAVVKKNAGVLNRLYQWLSAQASEMPDGRKVISNKSLLLIDDEADNASINTRPENDKATRINQLIRDILRRFDKSAYVGYTATPFANLFIDKDIDDLFPKDFIVNLPSPSNYIGPEKVFGFEPVREDSVATGVLPILHQISDSETFDEELLGDPPASLKKAVKCFILTCAIRRLRGQGNYHNSMLVHISRLISVQRQIKELVEGVFDFYRRGIEMNMEAIIEELRIVFEVDSSGYDSYVTTSSEIVNDSLSTIDSQIQVHDWSDVLVHLNDAASRITVREINGGSADALNYFDNPNGLSVIAIGGDKLSRGLTLEGLSVSYYLRASKMYDTLMQMGRWFGYRPGYVDLCRLFISRELNEWFCHITLASQQLREEFDYMADVAASTPDKYALRVRTHPGVLQISASNKIRRAVEVRVSWSGRLIESYELSKNIDIRQRNYGAAARLIENMNAVHEKIGPNYLYRDVPLTNIKSFLQAFRTDDNLKSASTTNILRFVELNEHYHEMQKWRVGVISKERGGVKHQFAGLDIKLILRRQDAKSNSQVYFIRKSHIISPGDEFIDLTSEELQTALKQTADHWRESGKTGMPDYPSGEIVRNTVRKPDKPLLLIYCLDPTGAKLEDDLPIIGYAISFPGNDRDDAVSFAVHEQLLNEFDQQDDLDLTLQEDDEDY
ncbi:Z1 domain-containing protein [Flavitalea antarctica]